MLAACESSLVAANTFPAELPPDIASRHVHSYARDPEATFGATLRALEAMQYKVQSSDAELGFITARGGYVKYNPVLVATGMVVINGAIIAACALGNASSCFGVELDSSHEFVVYVQVWQRPGDGSTSVRANFVGVTTGAAGSKRKALEAQPEQYEAFFTILDRQFEVQTSAGEP